MNSTAIEREGFCLIWGDRDCWPFVRILIVTVVLLSAAPCLLGWTLDTSRLFAMARQVLGVVSVLALISFPLAELYLLIFAVPLYIIGVLNDWFYDASRWVCRAFFGIRSGTILALCGLLGECLFFNGLAYLLRSIFL